MSRPLGAVLVGGASSRMGGSPKGLLSGPSGEPLAARVAGLLAAECDEVVLVGNTGAYASLGLATVPDREPGKGPLGGLVSALERAGERPLVALACDMPFVTARLIERLARAPARAPVVAASREGGLEPLFARYDAPRVLPVAERRLAEGLLSLRGLLAEAGCEPLPLEPGEASALDDWDTPDDVARGRG